jgi:hypothetical protein
LFTRFSIHSALHPDWKSAQTFRHADNQAANQNRLYFSDCARKLTDYRSSLDSSFGEISHRRRKQYGPFWLVVGDCKVELPEEFSLFEVFNALPLALDPAFFNDSLLQKYLIRVLDSLNERYKLLRSAGLSPQIWLERTNPSIAVLRDLKQLRTDSDIYLKSGQANTVISAFRMAFGAKISVEQRKKIAGCLNFDEYAQTEYGQSMLKYSALSLDQSNPDNSEEQLSLYEALPGSDFEEEMMQSKVAKLVDDFDWVQYLIDSRPELFDEIMILFFQQAIGMDHPLEGVSVDQPLFKNKQFQKLINTDLRYKHLSAGELAEKLIEQANQIIDQGIHLSEHSPLRIIQ